MQFDHTFKLIDAGPGSSQDLATSPTASEVSEAIQTEAHMQIEERQSLAQVDLASLAHTHDLQSLIRIAEEAGQEVIDGGSLGDGFTLLDSKGKNTLVGVTFLILDWRFVTDKSTGREFVTVRLKDEQGRCLRINDGSHGIYRQLRDISERGLKPPILQKGGLRRSEYDAWDAAGNPVKGVTYYLA